MSILQGIDWSPFWVSVKTGVAATILACFFGIFFARRSMNMKNGSRAVLDGILTLPLVLPPTASGFLLFLLFNLRDRGNGGNVTAFDSHLVENWEGYIIASAVIALPLIYRSARTAFENVDEKWIHAARTLGMGELQVFFRVVLPVSGRSLALGVVATFLRAAGEYGATAVLAQNLSAKAETLAMAIAAQAAAGNYPAAGFLSGAAVCISLLLLIIFNIISGHGMKARRWI